MKGTIRLVLGLLLVMGGVGGIETSAVEVIPMDSLGIALVGMFLMGWAAYDMNKLEN